ncbi:MAG: 5-formyltetrahydrofolate cyclo-ligase [Ruminococcaceae bacterium]|nr:5-formyltetrahydrofolate cyclo-ligase [Oscillospiraceae bacterium]
MSIVREQKNEIRVKYKALRASLDKEHKVVCDHKICKRFLSLASYRYSDILLLYSPIKDEIDISEIALTALRQGKKIAFPKCNTDTNTMTYHYISDLSELTPGAMNIPEPSSSAPIFELSDSEKKPTLCLVPALVFDTNGYRIGYGKGYYDRFLCDFKGTTVGLIYADFVLNSIPRGKYDLSVDVLVTEKGVKTTNAN